MGRILKWALAFVTLAIAAFAGYKYLYKKTVSQSAIIATNAPLLAVYNHNSANAAVSDVKNYTHLYLRITSNGSDDVSSVLGKVWKTGEPVLISVETWPATSEKFSRENILSLVEKGSFDGKIKSLASFISKQNQAILVRLNPDMEVYVPEYPWQMQSPDLYSKAYNHFAALLKKEAPAVKMIWSPAGYPGTEEYWPGAQWVDMVAVTLKGKSELQTNNYPEEKSQQQLLFRKLHRMRFFDKPVLVIGSEKLGINDFKQTEFDAAVNYIEANKDVEFIDVNAADKTIPAGVERKDSSLITGVFDPMHKLVDSIHITTEHLFVNIPTLKSGLFKRRFDSVLQRQRTVIVTMEPWKDKTLQKDPDLMANILKGRYDSLFEQMYAVIGTTNKTIYLRWLHEMEIPITRYPWQSQDPIQYIKAYRYFVNFVRSKKPQHIYFVWGPAGDRGSMEFWPGSDVVDYTSIAVYGLPDKNITDHNKQESFNTIFKRKYRRIAFTHKPLFITEFGVKGPPDFKTKWLADAAAVIEANKQINGISYFNDSDSPKAWGDIEAPDWSVPPAVYKSFLHQLITAAKK
jgi:beta-mannanase